MDEKKILKRTIAKSEQLSYIEVPFSVSDKVRQINVAYEVESKNGGETVVDLGVRDPYRVRGWSGGARSNLYLGQSEATPGYLPGELPPGNWAVLLGAYRIPQEGCTVILNVTLESGKQLNCEKHWFKGDLHMHSVHSDGDYTLEEADEIAAAKGLDFIGLTDHNTVSQNFSAVKRDGVLRIPGMELTTYWGHCNLFGAKDPVKDFRVENIEQLHACIRESRSNGVKISINHPFERGCPWDWGWDVDYDWVEVWNGPWRSGNEETVLWWQKKLEEGRRIVAVGGSDTHRPDPYVKHGMPTTWVKSSSCSLTDVIEGIGKGHVVVSFAPEGPFIELSSGNAITGDVIKNAEGHRQVKLVASRVEEGDQIAIISEKGVEIEKGVSSGKNDPFLLTWPVSGRRFYRAEIRKKFPDIDKKLMAVLTNPIYFDYDS
jgi:hypothetical protein